MQTHRPTVFPLALPLLALAACVDPSAPADAGERDVDADASEGDAPSADADTTGLPDALVRAGVAPFTAQGTLVDPPAPVPTKGPIPPRPDGSYLLVDGPTGAAWIPYERVGDDVMIGDDVRLGTFAEVFGESADDTSPRALAESTIGERWPGGVVYYDIDVDVGIPNAIVIGDALDRLEAALPIRFVEDPDATDRIHFVLWNQDFGLSEGIGMDGGEQKIKLPQTVNVRTVAHEVLHALGRFHEQQRADRDSFVEYHPECVAAGAEGNFSTIVGELDLGPYDLGSLMHYRGTSQCAKDINDQCICATLEYPGTNDPVVSPTANCDQVADPICFFSDLDVGAMWTMYGDFTDESVTANDYLGWATAAGDFDGDGLDDVASSAVLAQSWAGKVMTFKGSYGIQNGMWEKVDPGVVPWRVLRRSAFSTPAAADLFGLSLAAGDFDGDGFDDLAVGAPGARGHGAVFLYRGSRIGLVADVEITPITDGGNYSYAADADFGAALAAADLNGDGVAELIVGAPGDRPGVGSETCGGVYAYRLQGAPDLLARWNPSGSACHAGAEAGAALAGASKTGSVGKLLVVGAPGADEDRGRAYVLAYANSPTLSIAANLTQSSPQTCGVGGILANLREVGDRFGAAVAAGTRVAGQHIVAIGSPGENASNGQVDVFRFDTCWLREGTLTEAGLGADEAGDLFGAALAIGDLTGDGRGDLLVGAPGEAVGTVTAGWMYTFKGQAGNFAPHQGFGQSSGGWTNGNGERFGQSFALAEVDGNIIDLVVGAPGNHVGAANYAGSLFLWQGRGDNAPAAWRALSVDSKSPYAR